MRITIGIPTNRAFKTRTVESLLKLVAHGGYDYRIVIKTEGMTVADNRNEIAEEAVKNGSDYLLFIDDDMTFEPDLVDRLIAHKKDIIGVNAKTRTGRQTVILEGIKGRPLPTKLFKAHIVGTGIILINTDVFNGLKKPWFKFEYQKDGTIKTGEDAWFCMQATNEGFEVWCDPTVYVGHIGETIYESR